MGKAVGTPHVLWIFEEQLGIEIADLSADFAIVPGGIKCIDGVNSAYAVSQIRPKGFEIVANRRNNTHTSDNYPALSHVVALKRRSVERSTCSHPDVLHRLEEFSFRSNGRRNDDFGLLELRDVACSYVAHASRDCTNEILAAVIHFRRAKENLFKRTGAAHFDACATWKIGVRSGHAPMVSPSRRFVRLGERAAHHDRVCPTSQRLANISSSAHPAIGNDRHIARCLLKVSIARGRAIHRRSYLRHTESENTPRGAGGPGSHAH